MACALIHNDALPDASARSERRAIDVHAVLDLTGFAALFCWVTLREGFVGSDGATLYNYLPYTAIAQIVVLLALGAWGLARRDAQLPISLVVISAALGCAGGIAGFATPMPLHTPALNAIGAAVLGATQVVIGTYWGLRLTQVSARRASLTLCGGMAIAAALALACVLGGNGLCAALGLGLPLASGLLAIASHRAPAPASNAPAVSIVDPIHHAARPPKLPTLVLLGCAVQASAFFAGVTSFPFAIHSEPIMEYWLILSCGVMVLGVILFACRLRAASQVIMLLTLGMLFVGLFLLQSRMVGSVVVPLGLTLAGRTCCVGVGWLTLVRLARSRPERGLALMALGALGLNGTIGCALGVLANNLLSISYNDITFGASAVIVVFLVAYLMLETRRDFAATLVPPRTARERHVAAEEKPLPEAEQFLLMIGATPEEQRIAELICAHATYEDIATATNTSLRTVKYQAGNLFEKAHAPNRRAFEKLMQRFES